MGKLFDFLKKKKQPQQSNDPGGYKAMPYGSFKQDYISDGWGFGGGQSNKNREEAVRAAQAQQQMPQVDPNNAMQSMVQLLGPTPAEREAQEQKLLENKRKMIAWTGLFDGLRQLGNLYYASKGATPQQYTDPYQQIEHNYQQERQYQDALQRNRQAYAKQLYDLQRQADQDVMRKEAHQAQMNWRKSQEDDLKEKRRQTDEKNQAVIKYYDALEKKNEEQAAYWKAKAEGYPDEVAARIAKYNRTGGGGGKSNSQETETVVEEYIDDKTGRKVKRTVKKPRSGGGSGRDYSQFERGKSGNNQTSGKDWEQYRTN